MANPFCDKSYLWIVWSPNPVVAQHCEVVGIYKSRAEATFVAERTGADRLTPVRDLVMSDILKSIGRDYLEKQV